MRLNRLEMQQVIHAQVIRAEDKANKNTWVSCVFCYLTKEKFGDNDVKGLAEETGKSDDTIYDRANAYKMFRELCEHDTGKHRLFVFQARRAPYIKWSHFRALHDAKRNYNLTTAQVMNLLYGIVSAEGSISSRKVDGFVQGKYGVDRGWQYYIGKLETNLFKILSDPKTPKAIRDEAKRFAKVIPKKS